MPAAVESYGLNITADLAETEGGAWTATLVIAALTMTAGSAARMAVPGEYEDRAAALRAACKQVADKLA